MNEQDKVLVTARLLIRQFTGQPQVLTIPRPFVRMTGDHVSALLLNQILYWSERTNDPDGWFWKTNDHWQEELGITPRQVRRAIENLYRVGVSVKRKKVNGTPKNHYRIDVDVFTVALVESLRTYNRPLLKKCGSGQSECDDTPESDTVGISRVPEYDLSQSSPHVNMTKGDSDVSLLLDGDVSSLSESDVSLHSFIDTKITAKTTKTNSNELDVDVVIAADATTHGPAAAANSHARAMTSADSPAASERGVPSSGSGAEAAGPPSQKKRSNTLGGASTADTRSIHPAIKACRHIASRYPPIEIYDQIIESLGDAPDMERLIECRKVHVIIGWNRNAWTWALDWYVNGIPEWAIERVGGTPNGGRGESFANKHGEGRRGDRGTSLVRTSKGPPDDRFTPKVVVGARF
jgi:hypothetical protein